MVVTANRPNSVRASMVRGYAAGGAVTSANLKLPPFSRRPIVPDDKQPEPSMPASLSAAGISMIASNAVREPYGEVLPAFEKRTGHAVTVSWGGTVDIVRRVESGQVADIVIVPTGRIDELIAKGLIASRTDLVRSGVGVATRARVPKPDVSS